MQTSAIGGLVEGLLQGHAIREQKRQDAEQKERQHALDVAQQHVQTWREQQATEQTKQAQAQDAEATRQFDLNYKLKQAEENRRVDDSKARQDLAAGKLQLGSSKNKQDLVLKLYGQGIPLEDAQRLADMQYSDGASVAPPAPAPLIPGMAPPSGAQGSTGVQSGFAPQVPPKSGIMSLMPNVGDPITPFTGADRPRFGTSPLVQSKIDNNKAGTAQKEAAVNKLKADAIYAQHHSDWMKAHAENEKEMKALTQGKTALTHAQAAYKEAMTKYDGDLKKADTLLAEARTSEAIARTEYAHEQVQHTKNMDSLKASSNDLTTEGKKANLREKSMKEEGAFRKDKEKQEDALGKMQFSLNAQSRIAAIDKSKIDTADPKNNAILVQIDTAKANIPYLQQRIAETKDRIDNYTRQEKEAHNYVVQTTDFLNKSGTVNKQQTEKERAAAAKAAKDPPHLPDYHPNDGVPLQKIPAPGKKTGNLQTKPIKPKRIRFDAQGNQIP